MKKTTKKNESEMVWRLPQAPTAQDVRELVQSEVITKDEARQMLFRKTESKDEIKQLKREVELLRQVVQNAIQPSQVNHLEAIVQQPFVNDLWAQWFRGNTRFIG